MDFQVLIAHTGQRLLADAATFASHDAFKAWIAKEASVPVRDQISLTSSGKTAKWPALLAEKRVYVYDRRVTEPASASSTRSLYPNRAPPEKYKVPQPPDFIADEKDLQAWKDLFKTRRTWALGVVDDCAAMSNQVAGVHSEMVAISECIQAAVTNLKTHVTTLDVKNASMQDWAREMQQDAKSDSSIARLSSIPVSTDAVRFITGQDSNRFQRKTTLEHLVDIEEVRRAASLARTIAANMTKDSGEIGLGVDDLFEKTDELDFKVAKGPSGEANDPSAKHGELMDDIEVLAKKFNSDYEAVLDYSTSKHISQASKTALFHTQKFIPALCQRSREMDAMLQAACTSRNKLAAHSVQVMLDIASLNSLLGSLNARFAPMVLDEEGANVFETLEMVRSLPVNYASFLAETIRRQEWYRKVKSDCATLTNEMGTFQAEEARRRRKWQKTIGLVLLGERGEPKVVGLELELNPLGEEDEWPVASRHDLEELLETLRIQDEKSEAVNDLSKIIAELDNPSKQRARRAGAFKGGSIHEAALGRSTLLVRGDDDLIRSLQEDKAKLESKVKTADSRVRRLEDLLHRQSHVKTNSIENGFQCPASPSPDTQTTANPLASPALHEDTSRRSSVSSRRFSANKGGDEKSLQQKILSLESELFAEREKASGLHKEVLAQISSTDGLRSEVEELNSTKKDLMANFDQQNREFAEERLSLEGEIKRLKTKNEELDDELDRFLGSRENEKASIDDRVKDLLDELERLRKDTTAESQKAQGQVDFLRNDAKLQREMNESLGSQLQGVKDVNGELLMRTARAESLAADRLKALHETYSRLLPSADVPDDLTTMSVALTSTSEKLLHELANHQREVEVVKSERNDSQKTISELSSELAEVKEKLVAEQQEVTRLRESLGETQAKFTALEAELDDERIQLHTVRAQIADGETGSESLRSRVEEQESRITSILEDLAAKQSRVGSLEEELRSFQDEVQFMYLKIDKLAGRLEARTLRTKDLSQRLYAQNDQMCGLLERLSFSVTRDGESMVIQKIPKPERSNANDSSDPGSSLKRSSPGLTRKSMFDSGDLELLYWMHNDDAEDETEKFKAYMRAIGSFDIEAFCDAIAKRVRDMEYTAKKYSRDARSYREKSHAAQKESHEKIAFKSFKEGDLALFLPTRNQATGAWAAFNVGAPHYFLREQDSHKLRTRDWLVARIHKIEDRVVDLSRSMTSSHLNDRRSLGEVSNGGDSFEDDNPFDLSDGLRWYLIDATEEKPGAPSTPGLGKSTVKVDNTDAAAIMHRSKKSSSSGVEGLNKTLSKSLDSRRNSTNSRKAPTSNPLSKTGSTTSVNVIRSSPIANDGSGSTTSIARPDGASEESANKPDASVSASANATADAGPEVRSAHKIDELMGPS